MYPGINGGPSGSSGGGPAAFGTITGSPTDSTALAAALAARALVGHNHDAAYQPAGSYAVAIHGHAIADVTGLQTALNAKQDAGSYVTTINFTWANLAGKPSTFTPSPHTHPISDVTGLQTALDGKQAAGSYEPAIAAGTASQFWRGDKTWAVPAGAAPYWNEVTLAADFTNPNATFSTITGMSFTPAANATFEVQAALLIQTTTATNLPRIGVSIGAGMVHGAVQIDQTGATDTARVVQDGTFLNLAVNVQVPAGGLATANSPRLCYVTVRGKAGATPGAIALQMACETAGANVCFVKAGSQMRYKST